MCDQFWTDDPTVLYRNWSSFFPLGQQPTGCNNEQLNALVRFGIYIAVALAMFRLQWRYLILGIVFAALSIVLHRHPVPSMGHGPVEEAFATADGSSGSSSIAQPAYTAGGSAAAAAAKAKYSLPTSANPLMNVELLELTRPRDSTNVPVPRPSAMPVDDPAVQSALDDFFRVQLYSDPTDVFGRAQSQRQWTTTPSTNVPNDREALVNSLYRTDGPTCGEGNGERCRIATETGLLPSLS
jgi:hypothetical protein